MEPLKPEDIGKILASRPNVKIEDIHEYQRLVMESLRARSPFAPKPEGPAPAPGADRLDELHEKIFGSPEEKSRERVT